MATGRRKAERQEPLFVAAGSLPRLQRHPFYKALNALLAETNFDRQGAWGRSEAKPPDERCRGSTLAATAPPMRIMQTAP
jgi:hypothetical protein